MYLVVGDTKDYWCNDVYSNLKAKKKKAKLISNPLLYPNHFAWRLDNEQSISKLILGKNELIKDDEIKGVFIRRAANIDGKDWEADDFIYMQTEIQAAMLAWIWSLNCQLINRYPASIWYRPRVPLLFWQPLLRRCGLPALETLITNVEKEARAFKNYAVYGPLTSNTKFLLMQNEEWNGLSSLQKLTPVCLTPPHEEAKFVCIVGKKIIWGNKISSELKKFEPALLHFSELVGLNFLELVFANTTNGIRAITVEPYPFYEHFNESIRQRIVEAIVQLLLNENDLRKEIFQPFQRNYV